MSIHCCFCNTDYSSVEQCILSHHDACGDFKVLEAAIQKYIFKPHNVICKERDIAYPKKIDRPQSDNKHFKCPYCDTGYSPSTFTGLTLSFTCGLQLRRESPILLWGVSVPCITYNQWIEFIKGLGEHKHRFFDYIKMDHVDRVCDTMKTVNEILGKNSDPRVEVNPVEFPSGSKPRNIFRFFLGGIAPIRNLLDAITVGGISAKPQNSDDAVAEAEASPKHPKWEWGKEYEELPTGIIRNPWDTPETPEAVPPSGVVAGESLPKNDLYLRIRRYVNRYGSCGCLLSLSILSEKKLSVDGNQLIVGGNDIYIGDIACKGSTLPADRSNDISNILKCNWVHIRRLMDSKMKKDEFISTVQRYVDNTPDLFNLNEWCPVSERAWGNFHAASEFDIGISWSVVMKAKSEKKETPISNGFYFIEPFPGRGFIVRSTVQDETLFLEDSSGRNLTINFEDFLKMKPIFIAADNFNEAIQINRERKTAIQRKTATTKFL